MRGFQTARSPADARAHASADIASAMLNGVGTPVSIISQLNTLPALPLSTLLAQGVSPRYISALLGHAQV